MYGSLYGFVDLLLFRDTVCHHSKYAGQASLNQDISEYTEYRLLTIVLFLKRKPCQVWVGTLWLCYGNRRNPLFAWSVCLCEVTASSHPDGQRVPKIGWATQIVHPHNTLEIFNKPWFIILGRELIAAVCWEVQCWSMAGMSTAKGTWVASHISTWNHEPWSSFAIMHHQPIINLPSINHHPPIIIHPSAIINHP